MSQEPLKRVTYTPAEFAKIFNKERTWAYRQLYAGKVKALSDYGRVLIPQSEVDRLLQEAGRYLGANRTPKKVKDQPLSHPIKKKKEQKEDDTWVEAIKRKKNAASAKASSRSASDGRPSVRQSIRQRLTQGKSASGDS